jgi:chromosome segregation protein
VGFAEGEPVHLKTLTMRGFKSFASSTVLQFEPGITCIVGPNGSGKSNVVDALAWVMGEQGAKSLRGGKMEDVIFAGTSERPPLGRAEVVLSIDNSDGALPLEYAEVEISRTMFRSGGSEYAINGRSCRLLDVQELLSDSGIGREMHVVVGQGQLDQVLHATPEDRRGFVEEAAGVLKHRKRKEKALRKLDATEGHLTRLSDLLGEIRRQLKPLGRQAEVARRAAVVQADARDARARLLADDLIAAREALAAELADETAARERRSEAETALAAARSDEGAAEQRERQATPRLAAATSTWYDLASVRDRLTGTVALAAERVRATAGTAAPTWTGNDPDLLAAEADEVRMREQQLALQVHTARVALDEAVQRRHAAEAEHAEEERSAAALLRAAADAREGHARLTGQVEAARSRVAAGEEELGRLSEAMADADARAERATRDYTSLESEVAGLDAGESGLDAEHEMAQAILADAEDRLTKLREEVQGSERERAALKARREALELGLARKDGAGALLAATHEISGVLGTVAALLSVRTGFEQAVAAALGSVADAVAVRGAEEASAAIGWLKLHQHGRAGFVLADAPAMPASTPVQGVTAVADLVEVPTDLTSAVHRLLSRYVLVDDLPGAERLVAAHPDLVAVTRAGDVFGAAVASGGSASGPSLLEVQAAADEAGEQLAAAGVAADRARFELARAEADRDDARARVDVALAQLHQSDAAMAAVAERLAQLGALARSTRIECTRLVRAREQAQAARDRDDLLCRDLEQRLAGVDAGDTVEGPDTAALDRLADVARAARANETDARLALRTAEERARALAGRAERLTRTADAVRADRDAALRRHEQLQRDAVVAQAVVLAGHQVLQRLGESLQEAQAARSAAEVERAEVSAELQALRERSRALAAELHELTDTVHRDEVARAEQRLRIEALEERIAVELGLDADVLVAEYGPQVPVPVLAEHSDVYPEGAGGSVPYDRTQQQSRMRRAERALAELGRVNPLALEEFSALEERHAFLTEQMEDVRKTRRDLLDIVSDVDARVEEVFAAAYVDVEREFRDVFSRLFPGGVGRLVLTDPDDMLGSGIEVEARPAGKKVNRLSLLSGGERSLVAVAFLVALFRARPSPFYILDEVEAALDDTNLGRLLEIYEQLRENSQLLVITHQKRTMEVADALYGVSMRGDGVSAVISQRLRELQPA